MPEPITTTVVGVTAAVKGVAAAMGAVGAIVVAMHLMKELEKHPRSVDMISALPDSEKLELLLALRQSEKGRKFVDKHADAFKPTGAAHSGHVGTLAEILQLLEISANLA
ncbi:MAG TPA: hypothetical protein VKT82_30790 [Ktedonobacterales bacterium]|nr:hypothetical protein [Ktedonobacterales bacterium]